MAMDDRVTYRVPEDQERPLHKLARRNRVSAHEIGRLALRYALSKPAFRAYIKQHMAVQAAARDAESRCSENEG